MILRGICSLFNFSSAPTIPTAVALVCVCLDPPLISCKVFEQGLAHLN